MRPRKFLLLVATTTSLSVRIPPVRPQQRPQEGWVMMAPASDYFLSCLVFYIILHWLDMNVRHERSYLPYILLALLGVFAITIKLSAAPMLLLTIVPIYKLFHNRTKEKMRAFWVSVALAFVIVLPFLIRNIILRFHIFL